MRSVDRPDGVPPRKIKFIDLGSQLPFIREEVARRFEDIVEHNAFVSGKYVSEFEGSFASYLGAKHCVGVNNGTSALMAALMAVGLRPGDEVIVPVNTFAATAEAVAILGGRPVFVDIDPETHLMDVGRVEGAVTARTRAVVPVHIYGQCADMKAVGEVAGRHGLWVIEDACQAHGATYKGGKAGTLGHMGCFSFYPGKNLGAWGEAGAVVTDDAGLAGRLRRIRNHGGLKKYEHEVLGGNFRMEEMQGAVLSVKLGRLDGWNENRRRAAALYRELLGGLEASGSVKIPREAEGNRHIYHLFVIEVEGRGRVADALASEGIETGIHYPMPLHLLGAFKELGYGAGDFPAAERAQARVLSLPMHEFLTDADIGRVAESLRALLGGA